MESVKMKNNRTGKMMSWIAMLTALSAVGAEIKIPAVIGSVALDAFPALLAAALLGGWPGAIVGAIGHLLSALLGGFPLGPLHLLIAFEMAALVGTFAVLYKNNHKIWAAVFFVIGNSLIAPIPFIFLLNKSFYMAIVPSLIIGSILNSGLAMFAIPRLAFILTKTLPKRDGDK